MKKLGVMMTACVCVSMLAFGDSPRPRGPLQSQLVVTYCPLNGHLYAVSPTPMTWTDGLVWARSWGGELATVRTTAENEWIYGAFAGSRHDPRHLWIGLSDAEEERVFRWSSGDPVAFAAWSPGDPSNKYGSEHYVHIWSPTDKYRGGWNDNRDRDSGRYGDPIHAVLEIIPVRRLRGCR